MKWYDILSTIGIIFCIFFLALFPTSCSTIEILDGLCYNDKDGTYICPTEQ